MIFMATTKIPAEKTAGEISTLLSRSGMVKYIQTEYDGADIFGISFIVMTKVMRQFRRKHESSGFYAR